MMSHWLWTYFKYFVLISVNKTLLLYVWYLYRDQRFLYILLMKWFIGIKYGHVNLHVIVHLELFKLSLWCFYALLRWRWWSWRWRGSPRATLPKALTACILHPPPSHRRIFAGLWKGSPHVIFSSSHLKDANIMIDTRSVHLQPFSILHFDHTMHLKATHPF